jgi:diadenosine tetraphosphate (Ap4A) HIT family hydrolase
MSIFNDILEGSIKGEIVYRDKECFVILTVQPASPGHILIIPIAEIDHFDDLDDKLYCHIFLLAKKFSKVLKSIYNKKRVRLVIDGFGVAHAHIHLIPVDQGVEEDIQDIVNGKMDKELRFATAEELAIEAERIRAQVKLMKFDD